ncbi:pentapeptide repeat-containing protein [Pseudomonas mangiferae]|uniref:Pentapeptide repeat-containing protein n=1 Tax=Pseudomonas mangiferae TaxID=2593654 RepID=A0A553GTW6_9PSED|nr:pentapeptide repeat-containing protein [Pseudomonas mangiferae]TRX72943.1 pentapeptide repeat-containing protein [Pseudomonas mangiferae]
MTQPHQLDDPLYQFLRNENVKAFNEQKPRDATINLSEGDFRGLDLRGLEPAGIDFSGAYFRGADLRGLDLRRTRLEGASIAHAQISGAYFPVELTADEILMSVKFGTRLRYRSQP